MGDGVAGANGALSAEDVQALAADLRAGDVWRATEAEPDNARRAGMMALHNAALRRGDVEPGTDLAGFLDRITMTDLEAALARRGDAVDPTRGSGPASSLPSAASGA